MAGAIEEYFTDPRTSTAVDHLSELVDVVEDATPAPGGALEGMTLAFTGTLETMTREEARRRVEAAGGRFSASISTGTAVLVTGSGGGAKRARAEALGVQVLDEAGFLRRLAAPAKSRPNVPG